MKIKVIEADFNDAISKTWKHKKPVKQGAFWRFLLKTLSAGELKAIDFECKEIGMEKLSKDEPALFLMNHSSFTDLGIASTLLKDRQYHIICTNDGFIGKEWLMQKIGCIPTRKFVTDVVLVKDMKYCFETLKSSVLMYPEASYSFDGTETPLPDSIGKCIKMMKVPVVMIRTKGAFLRDPLYNNLKKRATKVTATETLLLTKEDVEKKSPQEIGEIVCKAFEYDHFKEQKEMGVLINEDFRAEGLERVLYKCPTCGCEGKMHGEGITISCNSCGQTHELKEDGTLLDITESGEGRKTFAYVSDWYKWEREKVLEEIKSGLYKFATDVEISILADAKAIYKVGEGMLVHDCNGFKLTGCDERLNFKLLPQSSYSLYSDYFWYEIGDMISIGDNKHQFYCFPKDQKSAIVAKVRLATEELYKLHNQKG